MAYFANSTDGVAFEAENCDHCVNQEVEDRNPPGCPIMLLHLLWNYAQHGDDPESKAKHQALDTLIPDTEPGGIPQCPMLWRKVEP